METLEVAADATDVAAAAAAEAAEAAALKWQWHSTVR
jgi:hypothetical protein